MCPCAGANARVFFLGEPCSCIYDVARQMRVRKLAATQCNGSERERRRDEASQKMYEEGQEKERKKKVVGILDSMSPLIEKHFLINRESRFFTVPS